MSQNNVGNLNTVGKYKEAKPIVKLVNCSNNASMTNNASMAKYMVARSEL